MKGYRGPRRDWVTAMLREGKRAEHAMHAPQYRRDQLARLLHMSAEEITPIDRSAILTGR